MRGFTSSQNQKRSSLAGYLLMEVVLALGIAAALLSGIFAIASGSMSLADKVVTEGRAEGRRESFLSFLERSFEELPGNAVVELATRDTGQRFLPRLTIQNAPASFSFAGLPISAQAIVIDTVPVPSGGVNVVLEYYEEPLLDDDDSLAEDVQEPAGSLILYRDIWRFELRVLDSQSPDEWLSDWDISNRLPIQVELNAVFDPESEEVVHYFWLPPKTSPVTLMQGLSQEQGASATTGGGVATGQDGGAGAGGGGRGGDGAGGGGRGGDGQGAGGGGRGAGGGGGGGGAGRGGAQ